MENKCVMCSTTIPEGRMVCNACEEGEVGFDTAKITVLIDKIADIKDFVNLASQCADDVIIGSGRFKVNAKSLMALFSLDLAKPLQVEFYGDIPYEVKEGMKRFVVN